MSKRSPPATPPAVLTNTPERPSSSDEGKRTRREPDSCKIPRRVTPSRAWTSKRTAPRARLASNTEDVAKTSLRIRLPRSRQNGLQRHLAADFARVEIGAVAGELHRAAIHHRKTVAEFAGKVEILFDQHDGDVAEIAQIRDGSADVLDDRGLDALGRLVEQQQLWPHHQRAPDRELLLLAAGEIAAAPAEHGLQHREQRVHVVRNVLVLAPERAEAGLEIFLDRQKRKYLAPLRHEADALARALIGLQTRDIVAVEHDRARGNRVLPDHRAQERGLADAVAPEHASDLAGFGRDRDAAQRLRRAVEQVDVLDLKHRSAPQIDFDDPLVGRDLVDGAFREHGTLMQAGDLDAELAHERHVVLDHHHGVGLVDLLEQLGGEMRLDVGHASDGFVDEKQFRILCEQHADLEPLLLAVAEAAGETVAGIGEADRLQHLVDLLGLRPAAAPEQRTLDAVVDIEREQQIVLHGLALEHGRLLEFTADAELGDAGLVQSRQIGDSVEQHGAFVGLGLSGDDVHHRGLAGAVRADDGAHLAGLERQREVVDGVEAVERDVHTVEIQHCGGRAGVHDVHCASSAILGWVTPSSAAALAMVAASRLSFDESHQALKVPTMPLGSSNVTRMNMAPSMNSQ